MNVFALWGDRVRHLTWVWGELSATQDDRVRDRVRADSDSGRVWPHARIGLNPSSDPVSRGVLHPGNAAMFRRPGRAGRGWFGG